MSAPHSNDVPRNRLAATMADLDNFRTPETLANDANLDAVKRPGLYHQDNNASAKPELNYPTAAAGLLEVGARESGTMVYQTYHTYGTYNRVYTRSMITSTWSEWRELSFRGHTHTASEIDATGRTPTTYLRGDGTWATPTNTTYSVMSEAEATAGTATTERLLSAAGLKGAIQRWATGSYSTAISAIGQALNRAATAADARSAIGAGTSDLAIGTTSTTAKAGDWTPTWGEVQSKPTTFPPSTHTHTTAQVSGLDAALNSKVVKSGETVEVWSGTQAAYDALPTATKNALGFIAVIR